MRGILGEMLKCQRRIRQIIKNCLKLVVEEWKPVLNARIAAPLAHGLVQQIVGNGRPELRDISSPETANGFGHKLEFRNWHQIKPAQLVFADLRLGVEDSDRLQSVAEKIETHRHVHARRDKDRECRRARRIRQARAQWKREQNR